MRKMRLLIAVVLIITGVVGTFYSWKNLKDNPAANGERAFPADHIDRLTIDSDLANLTILPGKGNDIQVEWSSNQKEFLHYEAEGNTLKIRMGKKHTFFF